VQVRGECHAGHRGEETPRRLLRDERAIDVAEVLDRWLAPDHRYFKVLGANGASHSHCRSTLVALDGCEYLLAGIHIAPGEFSITVTSAVTGNRDSSAMNLFAAPAVISS
jgi:hypothetical protein